MSKIPVSNRIFMGLPMNGLLLVSTLFTGCSIDDTDWITEATRSTLEGSRIQLEEGFSIYTPDGTGHYKALWTRDYAYIIQQAYDLLDPRSVKQGLELMLSGQREDGCMPDRMNAKGIAIYAPGGENNPLADCALDNGPFAAIAVCSYVQQSGDFDCFRKAEPALRRGLDFIPLGNNGLVWNDPKYPNCPYGFTDVVAKSGYLLGCSLYFIQANQMMAELSEETGTGNTNAYASAASKAQSSLGELWDSKSGMFFAATEACRQIDIWCSALAVHLNLTTPEQTEGVLDFLVTHIDEITERGQVRHLPKGEYWEAFFPKFRAAKEGEYQNGAFWATPLAWFIPAIEKRDPALADRLLQEVLEDFQTNGIAECVNGEYRKVEDFVVSTTSVYSVDHNR